MNNRLIAEVHEVKAAVLRGGGPLTIETLEMDGPRNDEVLVRIVASGICRTDIGFLDGWDGAASPVVLGHEGAGVVEETGKKVKGVKPGDHVVLSYQSCGRCPECKRGHPAGCESFYEANFGFHRLDGSNALWRSGVGGHFFGQSSFATYAIASMRNLVKVPKDMDLSILAPLGCGIQTGAGTVMNSLAVSQGSSIAILGTGAVGLAAVMAARIAGAYPIIGVDVNPDRLGLALSLGATHVIDNRRGQVSSGIAAITGGGADYALETTGDSKLIGAALNFLNPKGTLAHIAEPGGESVLSGGRRVVGIIQGDAVPQLFIPRLIGLYLEGRFPFDRLVRFYDFTEINRAIDDSRKGITIKPVLRISKP